MAREIRIKHLTNSLYQVEHWLRKVRIALYNVDEDAVVSGGTFGGPERSSTRILSK